MPVLLEIEGERAPIKIYSDSIEKTARNQLENIAKLPFIHSHVVAMPDVHAGIGATVGSVIVTKEAIIPAAVGVDIGCGMQAVRLSLHANQLPDNLRYIREAIENIIPVGFERHKLSQVNKQLCQTFDDDINAITVKHPYLLKLVKNFSETWPAQMAHNILMIICKQLHGPKNMPMLTVTR